MKDSTHVCAGPALVHLLFAQQAARAPQAIALEFNTARLSYAELDARVNGLAHGLVAQGVGPNVPVALALERGVEQIVAVLAVLKAGGACVPLDPAYPSQRLATMLQDCAAPLLLTHSQLLKRLAVQAPMQPLCLDAPGALPAPRPDAPLVALSEGDLAYVLYTSGSTGQPKGVAMPHGPIHRLVAWQRDSLALAGAAGLRTLQYTSLSFDVAFQEILCTLAEGGTLCLIDEYERRDSEALLKVIDTQRIERLFLPFVALDALCDAARQQGRAPASLRRVITAGEQLRVSPALAWMFEQLPQTELHNQYGPTETHVVTVWELRPPARNWPALPPIGRALPHVQLRVLDASGHPVARGEEGELYIGGACLALGYRGRPELTSERFVADPLAPGERLYRSGDRVRERPDGALEYLGRLDQQVKIRGIRIEPGEVEAALATHPAVRELAVVVHEGSGDGSASSRDRHLLAYLSAAPGQTPDPAALRAHLSQIVPAHMVPADFIVLDSLPRTPSGKLDRRGLPAPAPASATAAALAQPAASLPADQAPLDDQQAHLQSRLLAAWQAVLRMPALGPTDDLFAAGGHSLDAARLRSRLQSELGQEIPLRWIFEAPSPAALAERLRAQARPNTAASVPAPQPRPAHRGSGPLPSSVAQRGLWFLDQLDAGRPTCNVPLLLTLHGALDQPALALALTALVRRHEVLRTRLIQQDGEPVQWIAPPPDTLPLPLTDLRPLAGTGAGTGTAPGSDLGANLDAQCHRWQQEHACRPFDLARELPLRAALLRVGEADWHLLLTLHHAMVDGWSVGVLVRDLAAIYSAALQGQPDPLPPLPLQYADYVLWKNQHWLTPERQRTQVGYWQRQLEGAPQHLNLPLDHPRPPRPSQRGASLDFIWAGPESLLRLHALARQEGSTLFMLLLGLWATLLGRYTGQGDLLIGTPMANRPHPALEPLIGLFVNSLPLRVNLAGGPSLRSLLAQVRHTCLDAQAHQDLPFEQLIDALRIQRHLAHAPLFQVMFVLQNNEVPALEVPGLHGPLRELETGTAKLDLLLSVEEVDGQLQARLEYALDLFTAATAQRLAAHLCGLLNGALAEPDRPLDSLPLLTPAEQAELARWSGTARPLPPGTVHALFADQARATPQASALRLGRRSLSYAALDAQANALAHRLVALGVGPQEPVALALERSFELVIALLAILKAGGAYVPLDPNYPSRRLAFMLADCGARLLLTQSSLQDRLLGLQDGRHILLLDAPGVLGVPCADGPAVLSQPQDLAYILYTSGSTGQPKGVAVPHQAVVRLVRETDVVQVTPADVFMQLAPVTFDAATLEIWAPLLNGATLALHPPGLPAPAQLATFLREQRISVAWLTAALFHLMVDEQAAALAGVRQLLAGGDVLSPAHVRRLLDQLPAGHVLVNGYGPTENTTFTCCHRMRHGDTVGDSVPIGRPIANTWLRVLDRQGQPVPVGVPGELYIGGLGLALGYLNLPELTAQRFVPDPLNPGERLYRSGDQVAWRPDGSLSFLGRLDQQFKIRGLRIEPGDIEAALSAHAQVREAAVLARPGPGGERQLVAYLTGRDGPGTLPSPQTLRSFLAERLPDYMLPTVFVPLESLPLTANGKLDRAALPQPVPAAPASPASGSPQGETGTLMEQRVLALWRQALGQPGLGLHDNFFSAGGHSLIAARLAREVEALAGYPVPLAAFFSAQTAASFAALIGRAANAPAWRSLVALQAEGEREPLFFLHGWGGDVYSFVELARALGPHQPVYGLQAVGLDGRTPRHDTVEAMAEHYALQIRSLRPTGPCHLAGYSMGGWVAFATAQALMRLGVPVGRLILLDSQASARHSRWTHWERESIELLYRVRRRLLRIGRSTPTSQGLPESPPTVPKPEPDHYLSAHFNYRPPALPVAVDIITPQGTPSHHLWFWHRHAQRGYRVHRLLQDHFDYIRPEFAPLLARLIERILSGPRVP